jgi:hypothetical protein
MYEEQVQLHVRTADVWKVTLGWQFSVRTLLLAQYHNSVASEMKRADGNSSMHFVGLSLREHHRSKQSTEENGKEVKVKLSLCF